MSKQASLVDDTGSPASAPRPAQAGSSIRRALLPLAASVIVGCLLIEGAARWVLDDGMDFDVEMWKYAREIKRISANPEIGHEHRPGTSGVFMGVPVQINALGLRDRDFPIEKPVDQVRTLMLGDSLTFGWGVRQEDTPAKLLETRLNGTQPAPRDEVINSGVGNYNTTMEIAYFLDRGRQLKPDVVVLNYFINDAEPAPKRRTALWREYSYAYVFFASAIDNLSRQYFGRADWQAYYRGLYRDGEPGWAAAQDAIGRLAAYCRENDIKLLIVNYPELHQLQDYPFAQVTAGVAAVAEANNVPFLDLLPSIADLEPATLWVSPTDAHPNRTANERYARSIAEKLWQEFPEFYHEQPPAHGPTAAYVREVPPRL